VPSILQRRRRHWRVHVWRVRRTLMRLRGAPPKPVACAMLGRTGLTAGAAQIAPQESTNQFSAPPIVSTAE
jgi:hypothetical protein